MYNTRRYLAIFPMSEPKKYFTPEPEVRLVNSFNSPYDNAVAAARTCYSSKVVYPEEVSRDEDSRLRRDAIAESTYLAGHHTTLQHATFQFVIEKVSRNCIWSFLHSHPYYNSEQVSQRYVAVAPSNFSIPPLPEGARASYEETIRSLMEAYETLREVLKPTVEREYRKIFPSRNLEEKRWQNAIKKKSQEIARYVLPLATHAHLYHTISGLTLLRYLRVCELFDAPTEQKILVQKMVEEVKKWDPEFFKNAEDPLPLEETPEYLFFFEKSPLAPREAKKFTEEFDRSLEGLSSCLTDHKANSQKVMAESVRNMLGLVSSDLSDEEAIDLVMNPAKNRYLSETMNLTHHAKLTRAMAHPHFTFRKKISHTADSQDQRHRTIPGSRPVLSRHLSAEPDYVTPPLIQMAPQAKELYAATMEKLWAGIFRLLNQNVEVESALYLLPNAFPIRFEESGSLLDFHHKWVHRLCYTAQEEIWKTCLEEVRQVQGIFPLIGKHLYAPCALRKAADRKPFCPEGDRFCGVPVWQLPLKEYERVL